MNSQSLSQSGQNRAEPDDSPLKTDIVDDIQMHAAGGPIAPDKHDENLDKIMQDVGHELKKENTKPTKHHFFSKDQKPEVQPATQSSGQSPPHATQNHQQTAKPQSKPKSEHKAPVLVIVITCVVTAILIAVTYSVYSK